MFSLQICSPDLPFAEAEAGVTEKRLVYQEDEKEEGIL